MAYQRKSAVPYTQLDNDRVIVTQWNFEINAETQWHRHQYDYVVVPLTSGNLLIESNNGDQTVALEAGSSYSRNRGIEHNVININDYVFSFIEIELK